MVIATANAEAKSESAIKNNLSLDFSPNNGVTALLSAIRRAQPDCGRAGPARFGPRIAS